jgi:hypothetical protein
LDFFNNRQNYLLQVFLSNINFCNSPRKILLIFIIFTTESNLFIMKNIYFGFKCHAIGWGIEGLGIAKAFVACCLFMWILFGFNDAQSQVGVGTNTPDPTSVLDVNSSTKGMLVPRMLQSQKNAITMPAQGLLIYQTDQTKGFYYYDNGWIYINSVGPQGANGLNTLFRTTIENPGINCNTGGIKIEAGLDANNSGVLDAGEINNLLTKYVCNGNIGSPGPTGSPGSNGSNGRNTVAKTTTEPAGANCAKGGVKLEFGIDGNSNNILDPAEVNSALTKYVCNGNTVGSFDHYIGEAFGGGVIFHLWKDAAAVEHGLVVCQTGLVGSGGAWSNVSSTAIGITARSTWDGLNNCAAIVSQAGHTQSAAGQALLFISNTATDWYLPSYAEMNLLWTNFFNVSKTISTISGASDIPLFTFWTSTESNNFQAFAFNMFTGTPQELPKSTNLNIIAIRSF